jgi:hypothetical protein
MLPRHSVGAEIGVHVGDFSAVILDVVVPRQLHLIDPWRHETTETYEKAWYGGAAKGGQAEMDDRYTSVLARFENQIAAGSVVVHRGESSQVLSELPDDFFDWTYIDGNHLYEYVALDLEWSLRKTKPGGLITGDDYTEGGWWEGGVKRAVDEFVSSEGVTVREIRNGQFVLERSTA